MGNLDYYKVFETLGIGVQELDENYSPDEYGENLMRNFTDKEDILYSTSTEMPKQQPQSINMVMC